MTLASAQVQEIVSPCVYLLTETEHLTPKACSLEHLGNYSCPDLAQGFSSKNCSIWDPYNLFAFAAAAKEGRQRRCMCMNCSLLISLFPSNLFFGTVRIGAMLAYTPLDEKSLALLLNYLHDFLKYVWQILLQHQGIQ